MSIRYATDEEADEYIRNRAEFDNTQKKKKRYNRHYTTYPAEPANVGNKMFNIIKKVIDKHDPYGLLETHAPPDEYDSESRDIASHINENSSIDEIATIISDVFTRSFNDNFPKEIFMESAQEIKTAICISC